MELYFADTIELEHIELLESRGHRCVVATTGDKKDLTQQLGRAEVLIVRSTDRKSVV